MTKDTNTIKMLRQYSKVTGSLTWFGTLEEHLKVTLGTKKLEISEIAHLLPTEHELKLQAKSHTHSNLTGSKLYWRRVRDGKIAAINQSLLARVDGRYGNIAWIRTHPIWQLCAKPLMPEKQLKQIIHQLTPKLEGKLFHASSDDLGIQYKRMYWQSTAYHFLESIDELALRLILFRLSKLRAIDSRWPTDVDSIILLTLRETFFAPFNKEAQRLIQLIEIYILINEEGSPDSSTLHEILGANIDGNYLRLISRLIPQNTEISTEISTFKKYIQHQSKAIQTHWDWSFPSNTGDTPNMKFSREALFLADRAYKHWLYNEQTIADLFKDGPSMMQTGRPQIW